MKHRLGSFILALLVLSGSLSAQAAAYRCQAIFRPSLFETLVSIDKGHQGALFKNDLSALTEDLSWNRRRQVRSILKHQVLGNAISEREVARLATELSGLLFGKRDIVDNYIFKSKDQRTKDGFINLMNEKILREGLLQAWGGYSPQKVGALAGIVKGLRWTNDKLIFVNEMMFRTPLVLPFFLPKFKTKDISDALIQKVLLDGADKHIEEIRVAMKVQNYAEAYNTFRKLYAPIVMGTVLTVATVISYIQAQELNDQMVDKQLKSLEQMHSDLEKVGDAKNEIIEKAYQGAQAEFIEKWGEAPNAEEAAQLRNKIINGIFGRDKSQGGDQ
jgi:hypothetical protein